MRRKGSGSIRQIGKSFYFRLQADGKEKCVKLKAGNEEDAKAEARQYALLSEAQDAEEMAVFLNRIKKNLAEEKRIRLLDGFSIYEKSPVRPACGERHLKQHQSYWEHFVSTVTVQYFDQLDQAIAESYFARLSVRDVSFNRRLKSVRLIWKTVTRKKTTPFDNIRFRKERPVSKKEFTEEQLLAVFECVDRGYPLSIPHRGEMRILFRVLAYTGMSLKDCCLLRWEDIGKDTIRTRRYKTAAKVTVPIHPDLAAILPARATGCVMPGVAARYERNDSGVDKTVCRVIAWALETEHKFYMERNIKKYRIPDTSNGYGAHSFRHSFVSFCANAGVPVDIVRDIVGHSSAAVTRIYTHLTDHARAAVIAALPSAGKKEPAERNSADLIRQLLAGKKLTEREKAILALLDR